MYESCQIPWVNVNLFLLCTVRPMYLPEHHRAQLTVVEDRGGYLHHLLDETRNTCRVRPGGPDTADFGEEDLPDLV